AANELDQYGFFEDSDGSIWIAGEEGVTHMRPDSSWFHPAPNAAPPRVTRVDADGQIFRFSDKLPQELPGNLKMLRIDLGASDASPFRDTPLRWRLLPSKDWQPSSDGSLELRELGKGAHTLEVAYAGGAAFAAYSFRVGPATPWLSWLWLFVP